MGRMAKKRKIICSSHKGTYPRDLLQGVVLGTIGRLRFMLNCISKLKKAQLRNHDSSPVETFDLKTCQSKLAEHYQKTAKVPTTVWSSICQLELDQIYTRLSWVREEQTPAGSSQKELGHYTEMFTEKTKNGFVPKRILVRGPTGLVKLRSLKSCLWIGRISMMRRWKRNIHTYIHTYIDFI
ncbi:hypothetical protein OS493_004817 [Desmophyllum pertusum]|uniref:Uncharacterized protein n=1 Tax=Desmophyllum pertusum TaxID=174260 RepID=A0A9W9ZGP4_9CNID|nr:hypothetical protein OS493_004817 [Desmophyllum pertusum]